MNPRRRRDRQKATAAQLSVPADFSIEFETPEQQRARLGYSVISGSDQRRRARARRRAELERKAAARGDYRVDYHLYYDNGPASFYSYHRTLVGARFWSWWRKTVSSWGGETVISRPDPKVAMQHRGRKR